MEKTAGQKLEDVMLRIMNCGNGVMVKPQESSTDKDSYEMGFSLDGNGYSIRIVENEAFDDKVKSSGIVRRVDDLGRVVIPRDIRKDLKIGDGEPMEIIVQNENEIVLRKYHKETCGDDCNKCEHFREVVITVGAGEVHRPLCLLKKEDRENYDYYSTEDK